MSDRRRCGCGHAWTQHQNDEDGCWGHECMFGPSDRCQEFIAVEITKADVKRAVTRTGHDHPQTSFDAAEKVLPRIGSIRYDIYRSILFSANQGRTDEELESILCKKHQTISAARNTLMNDGLIHDSGIRRPTTSGAEAICWYINH